jgi:DNA-binding Xre family transcriptional regulator
MKNFNEKLKKVLKEKGSQKSLSMAIGMSEAGFVQMVNNNSIKVETLEKICTELDLPIAYFLDIELEIEKPVQDDGSI